MSLQQVSSSERIEDTSPRFEMLQGKNQISVIYALDVDLHQYSLMPCPFTGPKMFWAGPNVLCQTKNLFTYLLWQSQTFCARQKDHLHSVKLVFVPTQKFLKRH